MMNVEEVCERFLQMEATRELFDKLRIDNVPIWCYFRANIYDYMLEMLCGVEEPNYRKPQLEIKSNIIEWLDDHVLRNQFMVGKRDVLIFNHARRVKQGGVYKCIYTDEWLKDFKRSYYVYEAKYVGEIHFKPVKTKNLRYIDYEQFANIFHKIYDMGIYKTQISKASKELVNVLEEEFDIVFEYKQRKWITDYITGAWWRRLRCRDYYRYLLAKIQPKVIVYVVGYIVDYMIVAELAKEMGIPTIELQHGHIGRTQVPYNFKADVKLNTFPDYLFVTGQYEIDTARLPIPKENVYVVGSPELDRKLEYYNKALEGKVKKKRIITFISSGEYEIANAAMELYEKLNKRDYKLYLKLHPSEYTNWKEKYPKLVESGVDVVSDSRHDIYYYLAVSDYMIGISSTVLFEASRFKCKMMILKVGRYVSSESIIRTGNGVYIESMEEAYNRIMNTDIEKKESDYFYCSDSVRRMYRSIEDVIDRNR